MFGLGCSAVSRRAGIFKVKLQENKALQRKFGQINHSRRYQRGISADEFCQFYRSKLRGIDPG
jgi:hypothetical protein